MIRGITPKIIAELASSQSAQKSSAKIQLPSVNSLVDFQVLEKIGDTYKILVKGFLFQAKLPVNLFSGDEVIGRVISQKPFTILLDNLTGSKAFSSVMIADVISSLGLKDSGSLRKLLEEIIKSDKPLVKSKINRLYQYFSELGNIDDELLINLMINIFWSENENTSAKSENTINSAFDISFDKLVHEIVKSLNKAYNFETDEVFKDLLKEKLLMDIFEQNAKIDQTLIYNRDDSIIEILDYLEKAKGSFTSNAADLKRNLSKYLIQKAVFNRYQLSRDFIPYFYNSEIKHIIFTSAIPQKTNSAFLNIGAAINPEDPEGSFNVNVSENKIFGKIDLPGSQKEDFRLKIDELNNELTRYFGAPVSIVAVQNSKINKDSLPGQLGSINVKV